MSYAQVTYTGNGSTTDFTVPFTFINRTHVAVKVDSVVQTLTTHYSWLTDGTIQFVTAPASPLSIQFIRTTPITARLVDFQDAAILTESDLDLNTDQMLYSVQESADDFADLSVTTANIADGAITTAKLAADAVTATKLADDAVVTANIVDANVTAAKLAADSVATSNIIDANVTAAKLATDSVTAVKITDANVTAAKLASDAVTTAKILDANVTNAKLAELVYSDLTAAAPVAGDYIPFADISDSGNKKKALFSDIITLVNAESISDLGVSEPKLAEQVFNDLTTVTPVLTDSLPIADASDSGNKKKITLTATQTLFHNNPTFVTPTLGAASATTVTVSGVVGTAATGAITAPTGTTAQQPTGVQGMLRYNTTDTNFEGYDGSAWGAIGGGGGATGGGDDDIFNENSLIVTTDYTLTAAKNASSVGPITINSGITVTVPSGARWVII